MSKTLPLFSRAQNEPIAYLTKRSQRFGLESGEVNSETFLSHVKAVASSLDKGTHAINLCENRYLFLVSFCAVVLRGQTNLLPQNSKGSTLQQLKQDYPNAYILHDGMEIETSIDCVDLSSMRLKEFDKTPFSIPQIPEDQIACISFTSGSTGRAKPNLKFWRTLFRSSAINYRYMIPTTDDVLYQLATMPAQHMWGLETSILMPLFDRVCMCDARPLFPQDIFDVLRILPSPKMLVSTPVHLRALSTINDSSVQLYSILCATSPLTAQLAEAIEKQFSAPLREVYGCSEVGSMAVRRTKDETDWLRFHEIKFDNAGENTIASAEHLPESVTLQDQIELLEDERFRLVGRATDLIKIAGKRGSLYEINQVLLKFDGLADGIVFNPDSDNEVTRLCAIVSLKNGYDKSMLTHFLRESLDSVFIPRPIYVVETLPRESNGKILMSSVKQMLESLRK